MPRVSIFGAIVLVIIAFSSVSAAENTLVGYWFGERDEPGIGRIQWITHRRADQTFSIEFRKYEDCQVTWRQYEGGVWSFNSPVYATRTTMMNGEPANFQDQYFVEKLTSNSMRYTIGERTFQVRRVSDGMQFQGPANCVSA